MADSRPYEVSAPPLTTADKSSMVLLPSIPSREALEVVGRAALLFAQLEYYLIVVYKRALPGATLPDIIEQRGEDSLGSLLNGVTNRGEKNDFKGLIKIAEEDNQVLRRVLSQLRTAEKHLKVRKKYMHRGIGRRVSDSKWVFLHPVEETSEAEIIRELKQTCADIETIISQIQEKIPTPKS